MKIYQVHLITEVNPIIVSDNPDIHNKITRPQIIRCIKYCIDSSPTSAKLQVFSDKKETDECYALEVSKETIKSEITHAKELIAYWNTQPNDIKLKQHADTIIASQQNRINYYNEILNKV